MRKRLFILILMSVIVSTLAATSAVSAVQAGQSDIRQYDAILQYRPHTGIPYGKLIIDNTTGHYVYTANYGKLGEYKDLWKERFDEGIAEGRTVTIAVSTVHAEQGDPYVLYFGIVQLNGGGTVHAEGYLNESPVLAKVKGQAMIEYDAADVVP